MEKLKTGDIIIITNSRKIDMIAVFDKFSNDNKELHIFLEMNTNDGEIYFKCEDYDFLYYVDEIEFKRASNYEKYSLYEKLYNLFFEEYHSEILSNFNNINTIENYISNYLFDLLNIKYIDRNNYNYIDDIKKYILDKYYITYNIKQKDEPNKFKETIKYAAQEYYPKGTINEVDKVSGFIRGANWSINYIIPIIRKFLREHSIEDYYNEINLINGMPIINYEKFENDLINQISIEN